VQIKIVARFVCAWKMENVPRRVIN